MANERDNGTPVKRTFLVWSWLGLLGAYAGTLLTLTASLRFSGGFLRILGPLAKQGMDTVVVAAILSTALPVLLLFLGCVRLHRYSVAVYQSVVTEPASEGARDTALPFFRQALAYLIATWLVVLVFETLPVLLTVSEWAKRSG